ncbi:MAG: nucleotidyltransferase family protein, partial [Bacteroidales bacterium]
MKPCGAVIMAAGRSRRMRSEKLALGFDEKSSFLLQILSRYHAFGCDPLIVVVNPLGEALMPRLLEGFSHQVMVAVNRAPEKGRFLSLQQGLKSLPSLQPTFIHNVDNPFVNDQLLAQMLSQAPDEGFVSPVFENQGGHPLLLMPDVIQAIVAHRHEDSRLDHFLKAFPNRRVQTE